MLAHAARTFIALTIATVGTLAVVGCAEDSGGVGASDSDFTSSSKGSCEPGLKLSDSGECVCDLKGIEEAELTTVPEQCQRQMCERNGPDRPWEGKWKDPIFGAPRCECSKNYLKFGDPVIWCKPDPNY